MTKSDNMVDVQEIAKVDSAFQQKWLTYSDTPVSDTSLYKVWKKFLSTAPRRLNEDNYQEIPTKLWDEDFQIPPLESASHDKASFSREMDNRQEIEHEKRLHDDNILQPEFSPAELRNELFAWTPRNLTIFFIEYLIDSEINIQKTAEANKIAPQKKLDDRIRKIIEVYERILQTLNAVDYYASEPVHYDPLYNTHPKFYDIQHEAKIFTDRVNLLSILLTAKHFELLKMRVSISHHGLDMPALDEIIKISEMKDAQCEAEIKNELRGSLRRSQRIYSGLSEHTNTPAAPADVPAPEIKPDSALPSVASEKITPTAPIPDVPMPVGTLTHDVREWKKPSAKQILMITGIVFAIAALVALAVVATVFSGGTVALALAVGTAATLASFASVGGLMTVWQRAAHRKREREQRHTEQLLTHTQRNNRSINADVHSKLGILTTHNHANDAASAQQQSLTETTSPLPSASPLAQNQETIIASTLNANRR